MTAYSPHLCSISMVWASLPTLVTIWYWPSCHSSHGGAHNGTVGTGWLANWRSPQNTLSSRRLVLSSWLKSPTVEDLSPSIFVSSSRYTISKMLPLICGLHWLLLITSRYTKIDRICSERFDDLTTIFVSAIRKEARPCAFLTSSCFQQKHILCRCCNSGLVLSNKQLSG